MRAIYLTGVAGLATIAGLIAIRLTLSSDSNRPESMPIDEGVVASSRYSASPSRPTVHLAVVPKDASNPSTNDRRGVLSDVDFKRQLAVAFNQDQDIAKHQQSLRAALQASGNAPDRWADSAVQVYRDWQRSAARRDTAVSVSDVECHTSGCIARLHFSSRTKYNELMDSMMSSDDGTVRWPGAALRSSPLFNPNDSVTVEWILLKQESE